MGRPDQAAALATRLAALLVLAAQVAIATTQSPDAQPLEPAKAAIRTRDYGAAARALSEQAAHGNADAQYLLGTLVLADLVPGADPAQARQLFEDAAGRGQAKAAYAMAAMLATGDPRDPAGAKRWLERASALGDPVARDLLRRGALPLEARPQDLLVDEPSRRAEMWRAARRSDIATLEVLATPERGDAPLPQPVSF